MQPSRCSRRDQTYFPLLNRGWLYFRYNFLDFFFYEERYAWSIYSDKILRVHLLFWLRSLTVDQGSFPNIYTTIFLS